MHGTAGRIASTDPECNYAWGVAAARVVLGEALIIEERTKEVFEVLTAARALQERIGDPEIIRTEQLLKSISPQPP